MLYKKTIDTLIYNGTPHGKIARRLRDADAAFYAGLGPLADELAEDILLAGGTVAASFDAHGRAQTAAAKAIHARAVQRAGAALVGFSEQGEDGTAEDGRIEDGQIEDGQTGDASADDAQAQPGAAAAMRAEGLARLFLRSASGIAKFYEAVLPEISAALGKLRVTDGGGSLALDPRPDFTRRLNGRDAAQAQAMRDITQPYYEKMVMGGSIEQYEERALQLAACRLDHRHVPPESTMRHLKRVAALG